MKNQLKVVGRNVSSIAMALAVVALIAWTVPARAGSIENEVLNYSGPTYESEGPSVDGTLSSAGGFELSGGGLIDPNDNSFPGDFDLSISGSQPSVRQGIRHASLGSQIGSIFMSSSDPSNTLFGSNTLLGFGAIPFTSNEYWVAFTPDIIPSIHNASTSPIIGAIINGSNRPLDVKVFSINGSTVPVPAAVWGGLALMGLLMIRTWRRRAVFV